jgi:uncharacterized membrane protein
MEYPSAARERKARSISTGVVLGLGLGGFADGIALHQIAQWHNMGSAKVPPITMEAMKQNMAWDGWFHVVALIITIVGVYLLLGHARRGRQLPDGRSFTGQLLIGWGAFNLVEGLVDHHLLEIHHVRDLPVHVPIYDWLFLGIGGVGLLLVGWWLARLRGEIHRA